MAVRSLALSRTAAQPAPSRATLTSRMTSVSWAARPGPTFGAPVVGRRAGVFVGAGVLAAGFRLAAVRPGVGATEGGADDSGTADGRAAPAPGAPPPAPGARAATAA